MHVQMPTKCYRTLRVKLFLGTMSLDTPRKVLLPLFVWSDYRPNSVAAIWDGEIWVRLLHCSDAEQCMGKTNTRVAQTEQHINSGNKDIQFPKYRNTLLPSINVAFNFSLGASRNALFPLSYQC